MAAPRHVLLELDEQGDLHSVGDESEAEEHSDDGAERTTSSRFWGVHWNRPSKKWKASYRDADGKLRYLGLFEDEEKAARAYNNAYNAAIRALPPDVQRRRQTNPVVDGQLVPRARKAPGHGCDALRKRPRGVDPAAPPRRSARRSRQE